MAEIMPVQVARNMLAGYQGAQQIQDARQVNQLRSMQMQQAQLQMQQDQDQATRDKDFRNQLATYLQGGPDALAAMYAADPERTMQVQSWQNQQNQLSSQRQTEQAKQAYAQAQGVISSAAPADYLRVLMPDKAGMLAQQLGKTADELTDDEALQIAEQVSAIAGAQAGVLPEFTQPESGQMDGRDVFFQTEKGTGRTRVLQGVSPRPQKPLVQIDQKMETSASQAYGKAEGEAFSAIVQRGQDAGDKASSLRAMLNNPAITGPTQDFRAAANAFFSDLGVPIAPDKVNQISNLAQYKGMQNQMVLTEQLKQKGPQTESDAKRIAESFGNTKNIKEANELILKYQLALADRESLLAEMAEDYRERTGKIDGWRKELREYVRGTPLAAVNPNSKRLVFWNEFANAMREDNPGMTEDEIMLQWRQRYAK